MNKSISKDIHLSAIPVIRELIRESIFAEEHPDYSKGDDYIRDENNWSNPDLLMHRLYGALRINGEIYRVKITIKEDINSQNTKAYTYDVKEIELFPGQYEKRPDGPLSRYENNSISSAKLLEGVEKSYDKGVKLLDASEKSSDSLSSEERFSLSGGRGHRNPLDVAPDISQMTIRERVDFAAANLMALFNARSRSIDRAMSIQNKFDRQTARDAVNPVSSPIHQWQRLSPQYI